MQLKWPSQSSASGRIQSLIRAGIIGDGALPDQTS